MTAALDGRPTGVRERISTVTQLMGALGRMQAAAAPLALLILVSGAFNVGAPLAAKALGVALARPALEPRYLAYVIVVTAVGSLVGALAQRLLVRGPEGWLTLDRPLAYGVLVLVAISSVFLGVGGIYSLLVMQTTVGAISPAQALIPMLAMGVSYLVILWVAAKLSLWFIGLLMGRRGVTPAASWRLMRGATRGLVLGYVVFGVPVVVLSAVIVRTGFGVSLPGSLSLSGAALTYASVVYSVACSGLSATIYDLRVTQQANVADVFE